MALNTDNAMPTAAIVMTKLIPRAKASPTVLVSQESDGFGAVMPTIIPHKVGSVGFANRRVRITAATIITNQDTSQVKRPSHPPIVSATAPASGTKTQKAIAIATILDVGKVPAHWF